jgi:Tol biopolymer transport system component
VRRLLAVLVVPVALCALAPAAGATFKGGNGRVAYALQSNGIDDSGAKTAYRAVATVQPDGRADRFLGECQQTAGLTVDGNCLIQYRSPAWRRDGSELAFDAGTGLGFVGATGTGLRTLPAFTADDSQPAYAPSGRQLVFAGRTGSRTGLYVLDVATKRAHRIVASGADPDWSSGNRIVFERRGNLWSVNASGKGLKRITRSGGRDPGWSASGKSVIFVRKGGVYTAGANGRHVHRVVRCSRCSSPVFSPDGKEFAYDRPGVTVARLSSGRTLATLVADVSGGGERFDGSDPAWAPR